MKLMLIVVVRASCGSHRSLTVLVNFTQHDTGDSWEVPTCIGMLTEHRLIPGNQRINNVWHVNQSTSLVSLYCLIPNESTRSTAILQQPKFPRRMRRSLRQSALRNDRAQKRPFSFSPGGGGMRRATHNLFKQRWSKKYQSFRFVKQSNVEYMYSPRAAF